MDLVIYKIKGIVELKDTSTLVIEVSGGISYLVYTTISAINVAVVGKEITLFTELVVREDSWTMFGFYDLEEKKIFSLLTTVQGIGAKSAISILAAIDQNTLINSININDCSILCSIPGIGNKTAKRIINELNGKIIPSAATQINTNSDSNNVLSALVNLGFKRNDSVNIITQTINELGTNLGFEALLREVLRRMRK